ncbi:phage exclusion protein Lit family protein [Roseomonas mucosa]|uniref:phage exclusion protein Lit family protein n=1 Tax=Roseomonas mucosa TaxID=207340 RepID=UPI0022470CA2|nr:phage exclusion protein Lit family protein [Roseomonas mucosa]UZO94923.1 Hypothetical protein RMP42_05930 [Roseomonas mucosa]
MPLQPLFGPFEALVREIYAKAKASVGPRIAAVRLEIAEEPIGRGARAEFRVIDPEGPVRITWNGIASLWVFCQGAARLSRRMFDGKRHGLQQLSVDDDLELRRGLDCLEMSRRFCTQDVPAHAATLAHWPSWAPAIDVSPPSGSDADTGNRLFAGSLAWIFRHELAHISLGHAKRETEDGLSTQACETEADFEATQRLKGDLRSDPDRIAGAHPENAELQLEQRALANGLGLIWVALFEVGRHQRNTDHPPVAERIFACFEALGLREDSAATEVISDVIQAWIGPEENWAPPGGHPTARDSLDEAVMRLHRHFAAIF